MPFHTLDQFEARGKRVLLRADLNVLPKDGEVTGPTRLERLCTTIRELVNQGARVIICSHLGRPKGPDCQRRREDASAGRSKNASPGGAEQRHSKLRFPV